MRPHIMKRAGLFIAICGLILYDTGAMDSQHPVNEQLSEKEQIEHLVGQLTLDEKIALVSGQDAWSTHPIPRLGIPSLKMTDGPHGVRDGKATCFPTGIGMAATWNPDLIRRIGIALGEETRAKGCDILLGPCVNIARTPLNGRNFESFGEDPHLAARIAVAYVQGIQSRGIGSSTKHFACNNQERDRFSVNVHVSERALREIYLPAFEAAVKEAGTWTIMTAHNKINGSYGSANHELINKILKGDWGFLGFTVSDWGGVHDTVSAANGGQDLEMPGPGVQFDAKLKKAIEAGDVDQLTLDDKVRRILYVAAQLGAWDHRYQGRVGALDTPEHRKLAREAADECLTLLKNQDASLPLDFNGLHSLAVIGPNAAEARPGGGGSSLVDPPYFVTPLDGIRELCGERVRVAYSRGCGLPWSLDPLPSSALFTSRDLKEPGLRGAYYSNKEFAGQPAFTRVDSSVDFEWTGSPGGQLGTENFSICWTGVLVAPEDGDYELGTYSDDGSRLFINDRLFVDNGGEHGPQGRSERLSLKKGDVVTLRLE